MSVKGYRPANFDSAYRGRVTLSDSLILSLNIPFVRLAGKIGVERFADRLRELGFKHLNADDADSGLGIAIGNVEVTLVELVKAYQKLASGGGGVFSRESSYLVSEILSGQERSSAALGHIAEEGRHVEVNEHHREHTDVGTDSCKSTHTLTHSLIL